MPLEYILNNSFETVKTLKYREYYKKEQIMLKKSTFHLPFAN